MPESARKIDIEKLTSPPRLELINQLWEIIPDVAKALPVSDCQRAILIDRIATADASPIASIPWEAVKSRLAAQK